MGFLKEVLEESNLVTESSVGCIALVRMTTLQVDVESLAGSCDANNTYLW